MAHHGSTPAAWTGVTIMLIGFVVGGVGLMIWNLPMFWVGVALQPIGVIAGKIMAMMGMGADTHGGHRRAEHETEQEPPGHDPEQHETTHH